ncbi:MAG: hypothetical protein ACYC4K_05955 [Thiobacillus sp.]
MTTLIAGRFSEQDQAVTASAQLVRSGFSPRNMSLFYVNPQGQHDIHPIGGDRDESPGTHHASSGAVVGAAGGGGMGTLIGAATLPVLGPAGPLLGAAVGAYTGSLVGALKTMKKHEEHAENADMAQQQQTETRATDSMVSTDSGDQNAHPRKAGVLLAVAVATPEQRANAIEILGSTAIEIEEAEGHLQDGQWTDFDPRALIKPIE